MHSDLYVTPLTLILPPLNYFLDEDLIMGESLFPVCIFNPIVFCMGRSKGATAIMCPVGSYRTVVG